MDRNLLLVALQLVPKLGPRKCRYLVEYFTSPEEIFNASYKELRRLKWMTEDIARNISGRQTLSQAEQFMHETEAIGGRTLTIMDADYPQRLLHTPHAPIALYVKANLDLNHPRMIGIVGTRTPTEYGRSKTREIISELVSCAPCVVSGLAYGIDISAHKAALISGLPTIAVLGGGLDRVYPSGHKRVLDKIYGQGGAATEFPPGRKAEREHFPMRNRILAGMCDLVIVIESGTSGGSMITARLANDYDREVGALPGRVSDVTSEGTNLLIKNNEAHLITSAADIMAIAQWNDEAIPGKNTSDIFLPNEEPERTIVELIRESGPVHVDVIRMKIGLSHGAWSSVALNMEMAGIIRIGPGNKVSLENG